MQVNIRHVSVFQQVKRAINRLSYIFALFKANVCQKTSDKTLKQHQLMSTDHH